MTFNKARTTELLSKERTLNSINEIIVINEGLVHAQLKLFKLADNQDACSFAFEGLYKAAVSYSTNSSAKFSTYATVCIKNSIRQAIRNNKEPVRIQSINDNDAYENNFIEQASQNILKNVILELLEQTAPSARAVLKYWIDSDYTVQNKEIASYLNVSQPYVNKVINMFRTKLAAKLKGEQYWI